MQIKKDAGGRLMARAMSLAYQMGYEDARALSKLGRDVYPRKTGQQIASAIGAEATKEQAGYLQQAYASAMWQFVNHGG